MTAFANVNGETVITAVLHVPNVGPWWADVVFQDAPELPGRVTLSLGALQLSGTMSPGENGTFGLQRRSRIVGGAGGWGSPVTARHYHNDSGVRAQSIAEDAARIVGETIGDFDPASVNVGIDYVREAGLASKALEDASGGAPWHVDYDGNTNVGERSTSEASASDYQVLDFDSRESLLTLAVDDLRTIQIGSIVSEGLDSPETIHGLRVEVSADAVRVVAWTGGTLANPGRLAGALRDVVNKIRDRKLFGKYRYRVVQMSGDRVELQAIRQAANLPDVLPVSMNPGVAGAHSKLTGGSTVLVEFIEGDRTLPIVTAFAGKDGTGHETQELDFSVAVTLRLGSDGASEGATLGTSHKAWADGHRHAYIDTIGSGSVPTPSMTTAPALAPGPAPTGLPITADECPDVSSKVFVE